MPPLRTIIRFSLIPSVLLPLAVHRLNAQFPINNIVVRPDSILNALMQNEDTDGDTKITIDDPHIAGTNRGDKRFRFHGTNGRQVEVTGTYFLSNLLQELKRAEDAGEDSALLRGDAVFEPPVDRISRLIRMDYWDGLTRRMNAEGLLRILTDEKTTTTDGFAYVYVPPSDVLAYRTFSRIADDHPEERIEVVRLDTSITTSYVRSLDGRHGILSLALKQIGNDSVEALPFVVPGGRFNEMYGWDSYFITLGLLNDGRKELAKAMVDNFVYEIRHYGKILNANRTYYLTRSQPPFLTSMILAVAQSLPGNSSTHAWLAAALDAAIAEYTHVWMNRDHLTATGLSRYFDSGHGPPPEVEPGHFDGVFALFAKKYGMERNAFERAYRSGTIKAPELDEYFVHDRAMRESGHDTSYRLAGRAANLVTVDLNSLLYKIEADIAGIIRGEFGDAFTTSDGVVHHSSDWYARASRRKDLINRYLWNQENGMFFDYDIVKKRQTGYVSATTFYPLWAGLASNEQALGLVRNVLPLLERAGGIAASAEESRGPVTENRPLRQWDYPYGWAPHQMVVWRGLLNYGYREDATRLAYRWLYTITSNAVNYNGTIPEKFDVEKRSHRVFAEYGNVGTMFSYITREGFGWTNASYQVGLTLLDSKLREDLNKLIPPEWIF